MSNNYWDDEEDEDLDTTPDSQLDGSDLLKKLRKAKRADEKRIKELTDQLDGLSKGQRERLVKEILEKQGVNLKVAQFIPHDIEASEDAINNWLDTNGEVFGYAPLPKQVVNPEDIAAMRRMDSVTTGANSPTASDDLASKIANASEEELLELIANSQ
jgi:hypothetical protein